MPKNRFKSVSDYVCYVLAQVLSEQEREHLEGEPYTPEEEAKIKDRLRALGYL
jgi:hypothetical protein